ncbi:hypothetical protein LCGC14_3029450 [marine sediment metagenome]|uniref:Uncharacterized protein n=1 Tax=marine sediment metagenome TaxID=412755 RepID=A0A0F8WTA2_9ZZZZ
MTTLEIVLAVVVVVLTVGLVGVVIFYTKACHLAIDIGVGLGTITEFFRQQGRLP